MKYWVNRMTGEETLSNRFRPSSWLEDALTARDSFCNSLPQKVKNHCNGGCGVALKGHVDKMITFATQPGWIELLSSPDVSPIIVYRDPFTAYCSILAARKTHHWGHSPSEHTRNPGRAKNANKIKSECLMDESNG